MAHFITENCTGCTACKSRCPTGAITGARKSLHVITAALCIDCGACGVVCPSQGILDAQGVGTVLLKKAQRPRAYVDAQACTGCEKCAELCAFDCLHVEEATAPGAEHFGVMRVDEARCTGCKECQSACPYDAIFVHRRDQVPDELRPSVAA
jgi:Na+-translocating ferredoxin:NAD+ oxidoreductase subunit B